MTTKDKKKSKTTACFQFTSNSIQLAASFEILSKWNLEEKLDINYFWLGSTALYPSRMARGLDTISPMKLFPKIVRNSLSQLGSRSLTTKLNLPKSDQVQPNLNSFMLQLQTISNVRQFQTLDCNGIKPGGALANSFVYETGKQEFNYFQDRNLVNLLLKSYLEVYFGAQATIVENNLDRVLIYNGRFLHERAVWDACRFLKVDVFIFETTRNRYHLRKNEGFHDRVLNQKYIKELWIEKSNSLSESEIEELGSRYFMELESKRNRFYIKNTNLSQEFSVTDYFVFYSNSDDEAVGFWDSWTEPFMNQVEFIQSLQIYFDSRKREHFFIRLHPNLATKSINEQAKWAILKSTEFSTIFGPKDAISSYELLRGARGVISYGSTIGIEAAFHQIPSAILADCWYDELDVADKLGNIESVENWIENVGRNVSLSVLEQRRRNALSRGLWLETAGQAFTNTTLKELDWGSWEVEKFGRISFRRSFIFRSFSILSNKLKRRLMGLQP
jgi:hypothetical protein